MINRLIGRLEILEITRLSYATIWNLMRDGSFPRSLKIRQQVRWREDEIENWIDNLSRSVLKGDPE